MRKLTENQIGKLLILAVFLIILPVGYFVLHSLQTDTVKEIIKDDSLIRLLFVVEEKENDALFSTVLLYDTKSHKAASFNLPGNTGAIFDSLGRTDSLEQVYNEKGIAVYKQEVEKLMGITIPFYTVVNIQDFSKICDMLGGMRVFISTPLDFTSDNGERWLLPSGAVNLDGDKISVYLRYSIEDETPEDIQDRYQNALIAFLTGLHDNSFAVFDKKNYKRYAPCLRTNLSDEDERSLFKIISEVDAESVIRQTITGLLRNVEDKQLLMPTNNGDFIKTAVKQTTSMIVSSDGNAGHIYVLEIQNGTTIQNLARKTAQSYRGASYNVLSTVNADSTDYEKTVIIDYIGNETAAKNVGDLIHCTNIRAATEEEISANLSKASVDFTIILGKDFNGEVVIKR